MAGISSIYSSRQTVFKKGGNKRTGKSKHGDVKHIVFRDGKPLYTETIKISPVNEDKPKPSGQSGRRRIKAGSSTNRQRRSSEEVIKTKKEKLTNRLKKAVRESLTLWSEKEGIWISYQGQNGFLVKQFNDQNRCVSSEMMTMTGLVESSIPGLLDATWEHT